MRLRVVEVYMGTTTISPYPSHRLGRQDRLLFELFQLATVIVGRRKALTQEHRYQQSCHIRYAILNARKRRQDLEAHHARRTKAVPAGT